MNSKDLKAFSKEVRDLYCRTKVKQVEEVFVKLADSGDDLNIATNRFTTWLKKNSGKLTRGPHGVGSVLIDALLITCQLAISNTLDKIEVDRQYREGPSGYELSSAKILADLLSDPDVGGLLNPLKHVLEVVQHIGGSKLPGITSQKVKTDLTMVLNAWLEANGVSEDSRVEPRVSLDPEVFQPVFSFFLKEFSSKVKGAASRVVAEYDRAFGSGEAQADPKFEAYVDTLRNLVGKIDSGILANPAALAQTVRIPGADPRVGRQARMYINYIQNTYDPEANNLVEIFDHVQREMLKYVNSDEGQQMREKEREQKETNRDSDLASAMASFNLSKWIVKAAEDLDVGMAPATPPAPVPETNPTAPTPKETPPVEPPPVSIPMMSTVPEELGSLVGHLLYFPEWDDGLSSPDLALLLVEEVTKEAFIGKYFLSGEQGKIPPMHAEGEFEENAADQVFFDLGDPKEFGSFEDLEKVIKEVRMEHGKIHGSPEGDSAARREPELQVSDKTWLGEWTLTTICIFLFSFYEIMNKSR